MGRAGLTQVDDLELTRVLLASDSVATLRGALGCPDHLGAQEVEFVRVCGALLHRLGRAAPEPAPESPLRFHAGWVDGLNRDLAELRALLGRVKR